MGQNLGPSVTWLSTLLPPWFDRPRPTRLLVFIDLVQDIDVLLPLCLAFREDGRLPLQVVATHWLARQSPRTAQLLEAHGFEFTYVSRRKVIDGFAPALGGVAGVLLASESTHGAHSASRTLARRAKAAGLKTYLLQHGLENIGLFGVEARDATFESETVFCWYPPSAAPTDLPAETLPKLVHAGRPAPPGGWGHDAEPSFDLGVFENLHWIRYTDAERRAFQDNLAATAAALPSARILLRPHPAGAWADRLSHELAQFGNITLDRASETRRRLEGGAQVLRGIRRIITTPSTVALDAALSGLPTALAMAGGAVYEPLPVLATAADWIDFASREAVDSTTLDLFRRRVLVEGDGAHAIVERLSCDLASDSLTRHG